MMKHNRENLNIFELETNAIIPEAHIGWLDTKLPKTVMTRLQSYIETAKKDSVIYNSKLAGNITKSLLMEDKDDWFFQNVLGSLIGKFIECYPSYMSSISILTEDAPFCLDPLWVNFQKETEFNPPHDHSGIWSFVIWVKIPTDWREQHALPISTQTEGYPVSANSNSPRASNFEFRFTTMLGASGHYSYFLDKKSEGRMLFFPAKLMHTVYPFYDCDEERISISGNIKLDISENTMKQFRLVTNNYEKRLHDTIEGSKKH